MTKQEFLDALRHALGGLPPKDVLDRLDFYREMIDDLMEDGLDEASAVASIGPVADVAAQIISDTPFLKIAKHRIRPKHRLQTWEIILLIIGSPLWFSLVVAAASVVLSLYVSLWAVVVSLWAAFASFVASALCGLVVGPIFMVTANVPAGIVLIGAALVCAGLAILSFFGCLAATKGTALLAGKIAFCIKKTFVRREDVG
jgi:uncharacterized membrane protein